MKLVVRSIRNVFRSPVRLILVVALLGMSLMFVAAMASLATNSQQQLAAVRKQIGTTITIEYAASPGNPSQQGSGGGSNATPAPFPGANTPFIAPPHISNSMVTKVKSTQGVVSTEERVVRPYTEEILKNISATALPIMINGISEDSTNFTLSGGAVPTLVSGRSFRDSDADADVAMMSQALAQKNHLNVGSTFTLNGTVYTLIGLYTTSSPTTDNTLVIPLTTIQKMFHLDGVDTILVTAASYEIGRAHV